ncbi:hypothetical protein ACFS32_12595 [Novosphingobium pokkalii]|uniref:hypothetical protein n=1 Tax=Novosphingobium pokkalii TaxID=1770194 RepID=UPI00363AE488
MIVSAALGDYLRRELGVQTARDYVALTLDVNFQWRWPRVEGQAGMRPIACPICSAT